MNVPDVTPELPSGRWRATLAFLARLPQGALSRGFGRVADLPLPPPLRPVVLGGFARALGIDVGEAEKPLREYETLNRFFVRRLRPGVRRWPDDPALVASPVDGVLGQLGPLRGGELVQAKGRRYDASGLLGHPDEAAQFEGGSFLTLYLSPRHYHRIHTPCPGSVPLARHVPGALLPVNAAAVAHVPELFPRNERLLCLIDQGAGPPPSSGAGGAEARQARIALVAVGAYNVGRISAAFDPAWNAPPGETGWVTNRRGFRAEERRYDPPLPVGTGDEIMAFHLGSTVVLLLSREFELDGGLEAGREVRVGEVIGRLKTRRF